MNFFLEKKKSSLFQNFHFISNVNSFKYAAYITCTSINWESKVINFAMYTVHIPMARTHSSGMVPGTPRI